MVAAHPGISCWKEGSRPLGEPAKGSLDSNQLQLLESHLSNRLTESCPKGGGVLLALSNFMRRLGSFLDSTSNWLVLLGLLALVLLAQDLFWDELEYKMLLLDLPPSSLTTVEVEEEFA